MGMEEEKGLIYRGGEGENGFRRRVFPMRDTQALDVCIREL